MLKLKSLFGKKTMGKESSDVETHLTNGTSSDKIIGGSPTRAPSPRRCQADRLFPQTGRSMIEMLAVLAIIGVLTVGGIAAYSFAVSKHRANQIYNQVDLRAVTSFSNPFVRQATSGQTYPLAGFDEVVESITYQHKKTTGNGYDIIASHVPERVCRRLQDMTFPVPKSVTLNGSDLSSTCGSDNTFVFSYNGLSVGKPSSGVDPIDCNCSGCQSCESGVCRDNDNLCKPKEVCQSGSCVCAPGYTECGGSCYTTCADGFMRDPITCDCVCEPQDCPEHASWDSATCACVCEDGYEGVHCEMPPACTTDDDCLNGEVCTDYECVCPTLPIPTECQEITTVEEGCDQISNLPDGTECSTGVCLEGACCNPDDSQACCEVSGKTWQEETQTCCGETACVYRYTNPVGAVGVIGSDCQVTGYVSPTETYETLPDLNVTSCPSGQYCRVAWTSKACYGAISYSGASTMYGVCEQMTSNGSFCKPNVHLTDTYLREETGCSSGMYCQLTSSTEDYTGSLSSTGSDPMYGYCLSMDSTSKTCSN